MTNRAETFLKYWPFLVLGGIAFLIRVPWMDCGLPQQYHPDEWIYFTTAFKFIKLNIINTGAQIPNGFPYLVFIGYIIMAPVLLLKGKAHSFGEFYSSFYAYGDPYLDYANPDFLMTARLVSAVITVACGIGIAVYLQKRYSRSTALVTAVLFYLLPTEFLYSRFGVPDIALMTAMFIGIIMVVRFIDKPGFQRWIAACAVAVFAVSIKLSGAILLVPLAYGLWKIRGERNRATVIQYGALGMTIFVIGCVLLSPNLFFTSSGKSFLSSYAGILQVSHGPELEAFRHDRYDTVWQYFHFIYFDYGPVLLGICGIGLYGLYKKPMKETIVWLLVIVPFFAVFQCSPQKMSRYIIPVTSLLFILAFPAGLDFVTGRIKSLRNPFIYCGLVMVIMAYPVYRIAHFCSVWSKEDTREQARDWLARHDYSSRNFAREIHDTPLLPASYKKPCLECWSCGKYTIGELKKKGVEMLMISGSYTNFVPESRTFKNYQSYFDSLQLVAKFEGSHGDHDPIACNPTVLVFEVSPVGQASD